MQTLTLSPSSGKMKVEAGAMAHLAARLAILTTQLEAAVFERDLAQRAQARLSEEYRVLAATSAIPPPDLIQELELTRRQRAQLEHEAHLLREQRDHSETERAHWRAEYERLEAERAHWRAEYDRLEAERAQWRAAHDRLAEERQFMLRDVADLGADRQDLRSYAVSLKQFLTTVQHSRRWRFAQAIAGLFGRRWK